MRGERCSTDTGSRCLDGSSPHARGTPDGSLLLACCLRFIPACAGNASSIWIRNATRPVHPRMRGERSTLAKALTVVRGSSPHARGTRFIAALNPARLRFIPACAGNALPSRQVQSRVTVHPRMRGERSPFGPGSPRSPGSSPHARGTHSGSNVFEANYRFIPACAGNATGRLMNGSGVSVHPRMRGERCLFPQHGFLQLGSSPHARGTQPYVKVKDLADRFIPACAGNARMASRRFLLTTVHPRMRGERLCRVVTPPSNLGSSPHARGTRPQPSVCGESGRFIPACAGNAAK